jgi:hypothetical protein
MSKELPEEIRNALLSMSAKIDQNCAVLRATTREGCVDIAKGAADLDPELAATANAVIAAIDAFCLVAESSRPRMQKNIMRITGRE